MLQNTGIPKFKVTIPGSWTDIQRDVKIHGTATIENGTGDNVSTFTAGQLLTGAPMDIEGAGHGSWSAADKKPFGFTTTTALNSSTKKNTQPFGFPARSGFRLLAILVYDKAGYRTQYASELAKLLTIYWQPVYQLVELYVNDEFLGLYLFTTKVEKANIPAPFTYVLEQQLQNYFKTDELYWQDRYGKYVGLKVSPSGTSATQYNPDTAGTIANKLKQAYASFYDYPLTDTTNGFRRWWDTAETAKAVLFWNFVKNVDTNVNSWFITYNPVTDKFFLSPVWDFDAVMGVFEHSPYQSIHGPYNFRITNDDIVGQQVPWVGIMLQNPAFLQEVKQRWKAVISGVAALNASLPAYALAMKSAAAADKAKWGWGEDYNATTAIANTFIQGRTNYFNNTLYKLLEPQHIQGLELPYGNKPVNPVPVDAWSGPYIADSLADAIEVANLSIPIANRFVTMEVRLIVAGRGYKYWYGDGTQDSDLVPFSPDAASPFDMTAYIAAAPTCVDEAAAITANLPTYRLYKTPTGELRYKLPPTIGDTYAVANFSESNYSE